MNYWSLPMSLAVVLVLVTLFYVRGWLRLRSERPDTTSPWRIAVFGGGLLVLLIATGSPLAVLDHQLLSIHMVQHILLMSVAPALLLLGAPVLTLAHGLPTRFVRGVAGFFLRWAPVRAVGRVVFHPIFCWSIASAAVTGWHVPALFELVARSHGWHEIQQVTFFVAGILFWWPVIQPWPSVSGRAEWSVPLYLFLATLPCDALSAFLAFADRVVYRPYILAPHSCWNFAARRSAVGWCADVGVHYLYLYGARDDHYGQDSVASGGKDSRIRNHPPGRGHASNSDSRLIVWLRARGTRGEKQ